MSGIAQRMVQEHRYDRFLPVVPDDIRDGVRHCIWCGVPLSGRKRRYCGDACAIEVGIRRSSGWARHYVQIRDRGVCALCGHDSALGTRALRHAEDQLWELYLQRKISRSWPIVAAWRRELYHRSAWEADHIVPVSEGGGCCGLDNYRTLCCECHRKETAQLAARRAEQKRREADQENGQGRFL